MPFITRLTIKRGASGRPTDARSPRDRFAIVLMLLSMGALALAATPGFAQEFPTIERGFKPERAFDAGDIDQISLFNGSLSLAIPIGSRYPVGLGAEMSYGLTLSYNSQVWDFISAPAGPPNPPEVTQAWPARTSNAGLGWRLSLGEYWDASVSGAGRCGECYIGPDGAQHPFFQTLHPNVADDSTNTLYTRDGTYLRLRKNVREIDFPNGEIHKFNASGRLIQMRDRLGNAINLAYSANAWTISDGWRTHTVNLVNVPHYGKAVGSVVLKTFGGGQTSYTFNYARVAVPRSCLDTDPSTSKSMTLPLLTGITQPDGSTYAMPVGAYDLNGAPAPCDSLDYVPALEGLLKEIKLPSRGKVSWTYQAYNFPVPIEGDEGFDPLWLQKTTGVASRTLRNRVGNAIGTWTYTQILPGGQSATEAITRVQTPLGDRTDHYFRVGDQPDPLYGLPISAAETAPGRPDLMRSTKVYDCNTNGAGCALERTTYLKYRTDAPFPGGPEFNARVEASYTRFHDDGNRWIASDFSNFDGLGHYRTETLSGNFGAANAKTLTTNFNPTRGTYPGNFVMPTTNTPWVLETYDRQVTTEGGTTYRTDHCFDTATGFRKRSRARKSATGAIGGNDVVTVFTRNAAQSKITEQRYGGDLQTVGGGALCNLVVGTAGSRRDHTFQFGALGSSQYSNPNGSLVLQTVNRTIDRNTGLTATERDAALVSTTFVYDTLGRVTQVKPSQDAWVLYSYIPPINQSAKVRIRTYTNGSFSGELTHDQHWFDDWGRRIRERRRMPGGVWARRTTTYDAQSNIMNVSEWQEDTANTMWTRYRNHDPFGRPGYMDPPEGNSHRVSFSYAGDRVVSRTTKIGAFLSGGNVGESSVTTTQRQDRQGRLHQVVDATGTTTYTYDPAGRLSRVNTPGQVRLFNYDGRGFMTSERHPEKGGAGNGTVSYARYDTLGNAGRRTDGPMSVDYVFDRASRLIRARVPNGGDLKVFTYGNGTAVGDRSRGKVKTADRYNYVTLGATKFVVRIRETYTYGGRSGRTSRRDTQMYVDGSPFESFTQRFDAYDHLGNLTSIAYPQCTNSACGAPAPRSVSYVHSQGRLITVPGWGNLTYYRNGMVKTVVHGNGVTVTQANDPWWRARPRAISTSGAKNPAGTAAAEWQTGTMIYDGEGNVTQIGTGRYLYDALSRLKSATLSTALNGGVPANLSQSYSYDVRGNRTSTTTNGVTIATPAATTNRLTGAVGYDAAGNLTAWNGNVYNYDRFGKMWRMKAGAVESIYIYTADDERIWTFHAGENRSTWTLRDLSNRVLREYENDAGTWSVQRDYVYRDGQLMVAATPTGTHHFHLDHVGTPRLITTTGGRRVAYHAYYPFGQEATSPTQDDERLKFTSHERDMNATTGGNPTADDLDYMHARFYNPQLGRFLSVDPGKDWDPGVPQSWNLYAYGRNNPLRYVDPEGEVVETAWDAFNVGLGVVSLVDNIRNRRFGSALLDVGGIVLDSVATAVPVVPGGVSTAIKAARVADGVVDGAQAVKRGKVVIGHFPDYVDVSNKLRIKRFQVKPDDWKNLEASGRTWEVNRAYLDRAIARGDEIVLATPATKARNGSTFQREINHILSTELYEWSKDGTKLIPKPGFK